MYALDIRERVERMVQWRNNTIRQGRVSWIGGEKSASLKKSNGKGGA